MNEVIAKHVEELSAKLAEAETALAWHDSILENGMPADHIEAWAEENAKRRNLRDAYKRALAVWQARAKGKAAKND